MNEKILVERFSQFKYWFFVFFWFFFIIFIIVYSSSFLFTLRSVNTLGESYFKISIKSDKPEYIQTTEKPKDWIPLEKISKKLQYAIIVSEDGKFYNHPGIDIEQLQNAINDSFVKLKKKKRGASTITQQMIKNLYLTKDRTFARKFAEIVFSFYVETKNSKSKILETYLNIIEFGKYLYGINNASMYYFNKSPLLLGARESAFLAMLLPSPIKYSISFKRKCLTPFARKIIDSILLKMKQNGFLSEDEFAVESNLSFAWESCSSPSLREQTIIEEDGESLDE